MNNVAQSPTVRRVLNAQLCSGCGLCAGISAGAIAMDVALPGYNRPHQQGPITAAIEQKIADACPGAVVAPWRPAPLTHPYWGPYETLATGHATDDAVRHAASSGGLISALLIHALTTGTVEAVLHVVADHAQPTRNVVRLSTTATQILHGAGSRYAPSSPLASIETALAAGRRLAFVGKPCDVSALRLLGKSDPRVAQVFPVVIAFFCGGIPSHSGIGTMLDKLNVDEDALASFRYRGDGWPGYATAQRHDGTVERMSYAESWGGHLSGTVQFRCKICPDAVGGSADIACADAWYGDASGYPLFDEQDGRSLMMVRTPAGRALVDAALGAGAISIAPVAIEDVAAMQPGQARRKRLVRARFAAMAVMMQTRFEAKGLAIGKAARSASARETVKNFLGLIRRIVRRQQ